MIDAALLQCVGLTRRFQERVAVDGVSFDIARGETYGLLGPNGAGKTTTISMVAGILRADAGTVSVDGDRITTGASPAKRRIGLVPQDIALYPDLTAIENLRFFGRLQSLDGTSLDERIATVLDVVGLTDRAHDRIEDYSGGMKRRANIAVGLLHEPQLLILDEPTVGVDPQSRNQILESIEALGSAGLSVLYTTHYMEEAERLCDRVGIIDGGRIVAEGTRRELVARIGEHDRLHVEVTGDAEAFAAASGAIAGVVEVHRTDGAVDMAPSAPTRTASPSGAPPRPHSLEIVADGAARILPAVVDAAEQTGAQITGVEVREPDLEAVFLHLTGRALRD